jgi:ElaB/YqjD/DUF883 family membrane-anchored ribosome-binding protein
MAQEPDEIRRQIEQTRERMGETTDALSYKADVPSRVGDAVREKRDQALNLLGGAGNQVPSGDEMKARGRQAARLAQDNPLALAAGAAALGLLVGLILPSTRVEDERFGAAADSIKDRALEVGQEALDRGRNVAEDAAQAAAETARDRASVEVSGLEQSAQSKAQVASEEARRNLQAD